MIRALRAFFEVAWIMAAIDAERYLSGTGH